MGKRVSPDHIAALQRYEARLVEGRWLADDPLSDLIVDGARDLHDLELSMFVQALPEITEREIVLDAAIEVCLNSRRSRCGSLQRAADELVSGYPEFTSQIQTALRLGTSMLSTSEVGKKLIDLHYLNLPTDVGPDVGQGRKRYSLQQCLGSGSEGVVYLALDLAFSPPGHQTWVAVKRTHVQGTRDEAVKARRVNHPNVVRAIDSFRGDFGEMFYVFEHVHGGTLEDVRNAISGRFDARQACDLIMAIGRGVQAAHAEGLIHRDIKPSNILMANGVPKVADFGVSQRAKTEAPQERVGSLAFTSPQQFRNAPPSLQDDVYSLGGLLYWLLTGLFPNGQRTPDATSFLASTDGSVPPLRQRRPDLDDDLESICGRALAFDPGERYRSADALVGDLERWLARLPLDWKLVPLRRQLRLSIQRHPSLWGFACVAAIIGALGFIMVTQKLSNAEARRLQAELHAANIEFSDLKEKTGRATAVGNMFLNTLQHGRPDSVPANWIHATTFFEAATGSPLFGDARSNQVLWDKRIDVALEHLAIADAAGTRDSLESLLMESSLSVWLIRAERGNEALKHIDRITPIWRSMLKPDDAWLKELETYRAGAEFFAVDPNAINALEQRKLKLAQTQSLAATLVPMPKPIDLLLVRQRTMIRDAERAAKK